MLFRFENMAAAAASVALLATQANAFWGKGHLIVAREAEQILSAEAPELFEKALRELNTLTTTHSDLIQDEGDHPFTECATFADDIKASFGAFQTNWHFINIPYLDEEGTTVDDFDFKQPIVDVVQALTDFTSFLKDPSSEGYYVTRIGEVFPDVDDRRSFVLRMVIHYVGDIHQPLHAVAEVDSAYPKGDQGGNLHKIPDSTGSGVGDLHAVWDSVIYEYAGWETLPMDSEEWQWYSAQASRIIEENQIEKSAIKSEQFADWAQEDYAIAKDDVYDGFVEGEEPSEAYKQKAVAKLEERMSLGGRRLAELIKSIYGTDGILFLQE